MEKVPAEFLEDAITDLSEILDELRSLTGAGRNTLSSQFSQKLFRRLHTIKGSARTFGLADEAAFAHLIETHLQALGKGGNGSTSLENALSALRENFRLIAENKTAHSLDQLTAELSEILPEQGLPDEAQVPDGFPHEFLLKLSAAERQILAKAWNDGNEILILQFGVAQDKLAAEFKQIRTGLEANGGGIIAVSSGQTGEHKPFFRFLLATENSNELADTLKIDAGKVLFQRRKRDPSGLSIDRPVNELDPAISYGKTAADSLGKDVRFVIDANSLDISGEFSRVAATVFLHLLRNAVDHGIEFPLERLALGKPLHGTVEISVTKTENELVLSVCDDGRGIESVSEIFNHGYSTAPFVTETSGRGVGLDTVREAVQNANGIVKVSSEPGHGTRFEVDLPLTGEMK